MKVKLPILFNNDSTQVLQDQDIDFDLRLCEVKVMTFYIIDALSVYFENEIEYCQVYANGMSFYSTLKIKEIEQIIETNQLQIQYKN